MGESLVPLRDTEPSTAIKKALIAGDLSSLSTEDRVIYYHLKCKSLGLNPLSRPFAYLMLNGKLVLYALKDCKEQLRKIHGVSLKIISQRREGNLYLTHVQATDREGRTDEDMGYADLSKAKNGDDLGNAMLRSITKAKSRATLSICGLGILDESEVDSVPGANVDEESQQGLPAGDDTAVETIPGVKRSSRAEEAPAPSTSAADVSEEAQSREEAMRAIVTLLKHHFPEDRSQAMGVVRPAFGIDKWSAMKAKSVEDLRVGYERLLMVLEPHEDDVPEFAPPVPQDASPDVEATPIRDEPRSSPTDDVAAQEGQQRGASEPTSLDPDTGEPTQTGTALSGTYATPPQIAALKRMARQVGDDAAADVQDLLEQHPDGLDVTVYHLVHQRLTARKAATQETT
jgi:hypothetical protein